MELQDLMRPGAKVKIDYGRWNINTRLAHILAIVDGDRVVYKWWGKHKRRWFYTVESMYYFELLHRDGILKRG